MTLDTIGADRFRSQPAHDSRRRFERRACDISVVIATPDGEGRARVLDISAAGIGFVSGMILPFKPGARILIRHDTLGEVACIIRWATHPRYGAEFDTAGRTPHGIGTFYDSLSPAPGEPA